MKQRYLVAVIVVVAWAIHNYRYMTWWGALAASVAVAAEAITLGAYDVALAIALMYAFGWGLYTGKALNGWGAWTALAGIVILYLLNGGVISTR